jgi:hypothetical protein
MPIEIKELHIRIAVNVPHEGPPPGEKKGAAEVSTTVMREAIVAECVEQVMQILKTRRER